MEDDPVTANALSSILRRRGFEVFMAGTVAEGFLRLAENPGHVILDLMLPDGDGSEILRFIRATGLATKVIITTAVNDDSRLRELGDLTPEAVLQKPIDLSRLLHMFQPAH